MRIALVHYLYPPTVGGVERVMAEHAALFARHGHAVTVLCGGGKSAEPEVNVRVLPELKPGALVPEGKMRKVLRAALAGIEVVFVHNLMTMPFHPAATQALAALGAEGSGETRFFNWIHDLAATNSDYTLAPVLRESLSRAYPGFRNVAVSVQRQREFCALTGTDPADCPVIPNGIDPVGTLGLTPPVAELERRHRILGRDLVLLQPARVLRRKNIELGLQVTAELKARGFDAFYLVTGAPDPHHPASSRYGTMLQALVHELGLSESTVFASSEFPVADADLVGLYALADAVFLPSRQEGFGLPVLEAVLLRLPVFCSDREPMRSLLPGHTRLFGADASPPAVADLVAEALAGDPAHAARKALLARYRWEGIYENLLSPLCLAGV